ncbi:hypothetical protein M422DRAFT_259089 [Sphaerobolus stellatus SS14]|uniref:Uncharacterized protein n=1 Tax=Sphaerobolus stellatus (strain SS14) TaxID=990650 RepID=A0A0C9UTH8_SPHS4|nr:hypothetical protein M422DRAFT_259089 [Sphaerobolus stellatus SS14]
MTRIREPIPIPVRLGYPNPPCHPCLGSAVLLVIPPSPSHPLRTLQTLGPRWVPRPPSCTRPPSAPSTLSVPISPHLSLIFSCPRNLRNVCAPLKTSGSRLSPSLSTPPFSPHAPIKPLLPLPPAPPGKERDLHPFSLSLSLSLYGERDHSKLATVTQLAMATVALIAKRQV